MVLGTPTKENLLAGRYNEVTIYLMQLGNSCETFSRLWFLDQITVQSIRAAKAQREHYV